MEFNTVSISDGITMGTSGMRMSLVSREVIADSIEMVVDGNQLDGVIALVGCDKTIPGAAMALARINVPGPRALWRLDRARASAAARRDDSGRLRGGRRARGRPHHDQQLVALEDVACPGAGACGGQFTANTMAGVCEFLGLSPMGSNNVPAIDPAQGRRGARGWRARRRSRPAGRHAARRFSRPPRFENAIASVVATGGSTNAVLHLLAIAREAGVDLDLELFNTISAAVPWLADLKPAGTIRRDRPA